MKNGKNLKLNFHRLIPNSINIILYIYHYTLPAFQCKQTFIRIIKQLIYKYTIQQALFHFLLGCIPIEDGQMFIVIYSNPFGA